MYIFFVPYQGAIYPWYEVYIFTRSYEKISFNDRVKKWDVDNSSRISPSLTAFVMQFWEQNFSFAGNCLIGLTKKVAGAFIVKNMEKEYGSKLFSYFDIFIYVSSNFTLDPRNTEYLQCHIGLQLHTCFINFYLINFRENWVKEF